MGSKLKKHGGLKKGEKINDTHVDDLQDSGVKVKIKPYKPTNEAIKRRMDRLTIIATDPATGKKVIKIAPKKEIEIGKGKNESVEFEEFEHFILESIGEYYQSLSEEQKDIFNQIDESIFEEISEAAVMIDEEDLTEDMFTEQVQQLDEVLPLVLGLARAAHLGYKA